MFAWVQSASGCSNSYNEISLKNLNVLLVRDLMEYYWEFWMWVM